MDDPRTLTATLFGTVFAFLWGANCGSFVNVVAHRLPLRLSVVRPRSRCPGCRTRIRAVDNVPILSWLLLGARCRGCKARISWRYPGVEALAGLLALGVFHAFVLGPDRLLEPRAWLAAGVIFVFVAALLAASLIDLDHYLLPDAITFKGMWFGPAAVAVFPEILFGRPAVVPHWVPEGLPLPLQAAVVSVAGIGVGAGVIWVIGRVGTLIFRKEAMGFGDVKFLGMIGAFTGPVGVLVTLFIASLVGAGVGGVQRQLFNVRKVPFGPYLALGAYVQILWGAQLLDWYVGSVLGLS